MQDFLEKHAGFDIKSQLAEVQHRIAQELFNISRVVDDGNFHVVLEGGASRELKLIHDIPTCCKISLDGQTPPLHIKVSGADKASSLNAFASYRTTEPSVAQSE